MEDQNLAETLLPPPPSEGTADSRPSRSHSDDQPSKNQSVLSGFNYEVVPADIAHTMRAAAQRIHDHHRVAVIEVGRELAAVKEQIQHGEFEQWVERECRMTIRAAQRAMLAAEMAAKNDNLSYLPPDGLLALAAPSAPKPVVAAYLCPDRCRRAAHRGGYQTAAQGGEAAEAQARKARTPASGRRPQESTI